jgi:hypothetical protein
MLTRYKRKKREKTHNQGFERILSKTVFGVNNQLILKGLIWISTEAMMARNPAVMANRALDQSNAMAMAIHRNTATGCLIDMGGKLAIKFG